ncbi:beta-1,3-galactosyltransferase 1-like [Mya arenaria]|uniref:beta-1,3-galactosyltransferase 1-like n=1 Tax=Mya arenaria TaxID=6604 RepID=UPI0022E7ABD2|nr:beta-1,3-galactosyltransferase 1-like [Mya arenaria]
MISKMLKRFQAIQKTIRRKALFNFNRKLTFISFPCILILFLVTTFLQEENTAFVSSLKKNLATYKYYKFNWNKVNIITTNFTIKGEQVCANEVPFLLIIVPSMPADRSERNSIRNTYGSYSKVHGRPNAKKQTGSFKDGYIQLIFMMGKAEEKNTDIMLKKESDLYGDIVQADFEESYPNLTLKILSALKWMMQFCKKAKFVLKIDEDAFVNIPLLVKFLKSNPPERKGTVYGHIYSNSSPVQRRGRWKVPFESYPLDYYPSYAAGNSYVLSGNIIQNLVTHSEYFPYIPIEDAFITGILINSIGAKHLNNFGFTYWLQKQQQPCQFVKERRITANKVTDSLKDEYWDACNNFTKFCSFSDYKNKRLETRKKHHIAVK